MPNIDWKLCAGALAVIVVLTLVLLRLYPTLHRIEKAVVRPGGGGSSDESEEPRRGPKQSRGAAPGRRRGEAPRKSNELGAEPPRGDTDEITRKASPHDEPDPDFDL